MPTTQPLEVRIIKLAMRLKDMALEERDKAADDQAIYSAIYDRASDVYRQAARMLEALLPSGSEEGGEQ